MRPILCDPRHVTVVQGKMRTLKRIAADYPLAQAAFRGGFFCPPGGPGVGFLRIGSLVLQGNAGNWPVLYRQAGAVASVGRESDMLKVPTDWAIAAGPILLLGGYVRQDLMRERDFASVRPFGKAARTAVGIRPDGKMVMAAFPRATLTQAANTLRGFGCVDALAFDGGHGTECLAEGKWYCYEGSWPARIPNALLVVGPCRPAPVLPVLSMGSRGQCVRTVQQRLVMYDPGPVDGIYGRMTRAAVKRWQEEQGLAVTGEVGPYEWHRLGVM
jgi:hypothetical protein